MSHGRIRGYRPPVLPAGPKPGQDGEARGRVTQKPVGPVLGPGQHLVLPAHTGLARLRDHFDARERPDYDARLKGESPPPPPNASGFEPPAEASPAFVSRLPNPTDEDVQAEHEREHDGHADAEAEPDAAPPEFAPRVVELQGGLFTLADGSLDAESHPLTTLEAFLDGDVLYVSVAMDLGSVPYGLPLSIPALDAAFGMPIAFRVVHQTERTAGASLGYLEICVSVDNQDMVRALDRVLTATLG